MATLTDDFEDLAVKNHGTRIERPHFILDVPSNTGTTLAAVKDPLTEINKGIWVKYAWGSHMGEYDELTITLKSDSVTSIGFVNYRTTAGDPCRFYDAGGKQLGSAKLPAKSLVPVVCSSAAAPIKVIKVSVAGGPGAFVAFDDFVIEAL